jgi:hypothetical protein
MYSSTRESSTGILVKENLTLERLVEDLSVASLFSDRVLKAHRSGQRRASVTSTPLSLTLKTAEV